MSKQNLQDMFDRYSDLLQTITKLSTDTTNKNNSWCSSNYKAYNFDRIIKKYCKRNRKSIEIRSVDGLTLKNGYLNFIEFKNCLLTSQENDNIKRKIADSTRYIENIILDSCFLSNTKLKARFILVCSSATMNGETNYQCVNEAVNLLANKASVLEEKAKSIRDYFSLLKFFDEVCIQTPDQFLEKIDQYAFLSNNS